MNTLSAPLLNFGGEFAHPVEEANFRTRRLPEYRRQARHVFAYAAVLNGLFFLSDWRYLGTPHFPAAAGARAGIVLASLAGLAFLGRVRSFRHLQTLFFAWGLPVIGASAILVNPQTVLALFVICMLPIVFYLALPIPFRALLFLGLSCSGATLASFLAGRPWSRGGLGLVLAMATINLVLALVLTRINRLQRLEWAATRALREANATLTENRRTLETLLGAVPAPLIITARSDGRILQANDAARAYFGEEALREAFSIRDHLERPELEPPLPEEACVQQTEVCLRLPGAGLRHALLVTTLTMTGGLDALLTVLVDITQRKELEDHLQQLATTDPLTGLANRARFFDQSAAEVARALRHGHSLAVVMFDLDRFKAINDRYGHEAGDIALRAFASLCQGLVRNQDLVARIGGEEFVLLLPETDAAGALALAERIRKAVADLSLERIREGVTVSAGVAELLPTETGVKAALDRADQALYQAKASGRNQVRTFRFSAALG